MIWNFLRRCWLVIDVACNVLVGGRVESISSRMGRAIKEGRRCLLCKVICGTLDLRWKDHCVNNIVTPLDKE